MDIEELDQTRNQWYDIESQYHVHMKDAFDLIRQEKASRSSFNIINPEAKEFYSRPEYKFRDVFIAGLKHIDKLTSNGLEALESVTGDDILQKAWEDAEQNKNTETNKTQDKPGGYTKMSKFTESKKSGNKPKNGPTDIRLN